MSTHLRVEAEKLAERPYLIEVVKDETTDDQPIYVARITELEGCIGQGKTYDEAVADVNQAKVDFIESLLEDGLPVPAPMWIATTLSTGVVTANIYRYEKANRDKQSHELQETQRPSHLLPLKA